MVPSTKMVNFLIQNGTNYRNGEFPHSKCTKYQNGEFSHSEWYQVSKWRIFAFRMASSTKMDKIFSFKIYQVSKKRIFASKMAPSTKYFILDQLCTRLWIHQLSSYLVMHGDDLPWNLELSEDIGNSLQFWKHFAGQKDCIRHGLTQPEVGTHLGSCSNMREKRRVQVDKT